MKMPATMQQCRLYICVRLTKENLELPLLQYYSNPPVSDRLLYYSKIHSAFDLCGFSKAADDVKFIFK